MAPSEYDYSTVRVLYQQHSPQQQEGAPGQQHCCFRRFRSCGCRTAGENGLHDGEGAMARGMDSYDAVYSYRGERERERALGSPSPPPDVPGNVLSM